VVVASVAVVVREAVEVLGPAVLGVLVPVAAEVALAGLLLVVPAGLLPAVPAGLLPAVLAVPSLCLHRIQVLTCLLRPPAQPVNTPAAEAASETTIRAAAATHARPAQYLRGEPPPVMEHRAEVPAQPQRFFAMALASTRR
jgi:hypothetical protein